MAVDLLSLPDLKAGIHPLTIVVGTMKNETTDRGFGANYDIFLARLKTNLSQMSHGRITLIQNKDSFHDLRKQELETPDTRGDFAQTGGASGAPPASAAIQPDYELDGVAHDLPNRASNYHLLEFSLNNLHNRTILWTREYDVMLPR